MREPSSGEDLPSEGQTGSVSNQNFGPPDGRPNVEYWWAATTLSLEWQSCSGMLASKKVLVPV